MSRTRKQDASPIEVVATSKGYYGDLIRNPGDRFMIEQVSQFSFRWMDSDDARVLDLPNGPLK